MNMRKIARPAIAGALALAFLAGAATSANAAVGDPLNPQPADSASVGSKGGFFLWDGNTGEFADGNPARVYDREEAIIASASSSDVLAEINPSATRPVSGATAFTGVYRFLSAKTNADVAGGTATWKAFAVDAAAGPNGGTMVPSMTLNSINAGPGGIADDIAAGGSYWYGVAYTINDGVTVVGAVYREINITAGTGSYTVSPMTLEAGSVTATTTTLASSALTVPAGDSVILTAQVEAARAGSVSFLDGTTTLGTGAVDATTGVATFTATNLSAGSHSFTAVYSGDAGTNFAGSTSSAVVVNATTLVEGDLTAPLQTLVISTTPDIKTITVNAGVANAGKNVKFGSFPAGLAGSVVLDATGAASVDATAIPFGQATKLFVAEQNNTLIAWNTFTLTQADPKSDTTGLTATVSNSGRFYLQAPAATSVNLGTIKRGETTTPVAIGGFKVIDDRDVLNGWNLSLSAVDFAGPGATTVPATALGYDPKGTGLPVGVTLGASKTAGSGVFGIIAEGAAGSWTTEAGASLDADLTFKAPINAAKGVHTSTLTLDLVSK